jgi:hypothetical protein
MNNIKFRASSLADIMTDPKNKGEVLSVGAKTSLMKRAKEFVYGYDEKITSKYMTKGIMVEDESIELFNAALGTRYSKNEEWNQNEWITGTADIVADDRIIDIKSSWCLTTFPAIAEFGENSTYEWQLRAYMMLWNKPLASIAYCLVNTPESLIGYEDKQLHQVGHIVPELRVTLVDYQRDMALEEKIKTKVEAARIYYAEAVRAISEQHKFLLES